MSLLVLRSCPLQSPAGFLPRAAPTPGCHGNTLLIGWLDWTQCDCCCSTFVFFITFEESAFLKVRSDLPISAMLCVCSYLSVIGYVFSRWYVKEWLPCRFSLYPESLRDWQHPVECSHSLPPQKRAWAGNKEGLCVPFPPSRLHPSFLPFLSLAASLFSSAEAIVLSSSGVRSHTHWACSLFYYFI